MVGGFNEMKSAISDWNNELIDKSMVQSSIVWKLNTPGASYFGGEWEREIRTVRKILKFINI